MNNCCQMPFFSHWHGLPPLFCGTAEANRAISCTSLCSAGVYLLWPVRERTLLLSGSGALKALREASNDWLLCGLTCGERKASADCLGRWLEFCYHRDKVVFGCLNESCRMLCSTSSPASSEVSQSSTFFCILILLIFCAFEFCSNKIL